MITLAIDEVTGVITITPTPNPLLQDLLSTLTVIGQQQGAIMATLQEVKDAIAQEKQQVSDKLAALSQQIADLMAQLAGGTVVSAQDLEDLKVAVENIFTDVAP